MTRLSRAASTTSSSTLEVYAFQIACKVLRQIACKVTARPDHRSISDPREQREQEESRPVRRGRERPAWNRRAGRANLAPGGRLGHPGAHRSRCLVLLQFLDNTLRTSARRHNAANTSTAARRTRYWIGPALATTIMPGGQVFAFGGILEWWRDPLAILRQGTSRSCVR